MFYVELCGPGSTVGLPRAFVCVVARHRMEIDGGSCGWPPATDDNSLAHVISGPGVGVAPPCCQID